MLNKECQWICSFAVHLLKNKSKPKHFFFSLILWLIWQRNRYYIRPPLTLRQICIVYFCFCLEGHAGCGLSALIQFEISRRIQPYVTSRSLVHLCEWVILLQSISGSNRNVQWKLSPGFVPWIQHWVLKTLQWIYPCVHGWKEKNGGLT